MLDLKKTMQTIAVQMSGFTLTAKLLVGSLMIIMVMGLLFVALYAGRSEMVPLGLSGNLNADARTRAVNFLDSQKIVWEEAGDDLLVPVDRKYAVLGDLTERQLITPDQIDFSSLMKDSSPFEDRQTRKTRFLVAKMNELARMISSWSVIEKAEVKISQPDRSGGLGQARIEPTAAVTVFARGDKLAQNQVDAVAAAVAGAHAELKIENVSVIDGRTGRALRARSEDDLETGRYLEGVREQEKHIKDKIDELLSNIPGVRIAVNAQVEASEVVTERVGVDEPKHGVRSESSADRSMTNQAATPEVGVRANATNALAVGNGRSSSSTEAISETRMLPVFGTENMHIRQDSGYPLKINVTIRIPRSWFVSLYQQEQGDPAAEPDAAALDSIVTAETEKIRDAVQPLVDTGAKKGAVPGTVVVGVFADVAPGVLGSLAGGGLLAGGSGTGLVGEGMIKAVGLGALAVVSLFLMFMMVRRASREDEMPTAAELVGIPPALADDEADVVGEADETVAAMEGLEIDEGAVRRQQMIDQINDLAVNSADEAASLLRKWIKTDE